MLRTLCEAELWEEALQEMERFQWSPVMAALRPAWEARIFFGMGRYEEVVRRARGAVSEGEMQCWLAMAHAALGQHEEARRVAEQAVTRTGRHAAGARGYVLMAAGDTAGAIPWYDRASLDPTIRPAA